MGSHAIQSKLWGQKPKDWLMFQEPTAREAFDFVVNNLYSNSSTKLLDIGCGTGLFCLFAHQKGIKDITGFDATLSFLEEAKKRFQEGKFIHGEMEELPFQDESFDIVSGFNSFQYAENIKHALTEAKRVLKKGGKLITMIWGRKEDCEAATYLKAVGSLLPPPPPDSGGPFALSEDKVLESLLSETGFRNIKITDVDSVWDYPDKETALRGLMSAGPVAKAIENSSYEKAYDTISMAVNPYLQPNGHVVYRNKWRVAISEK